MKLPLSVFFRLSLYFLLVSLKFLLVLKSFNNECRLFKLSLMFKGSFQNVSRKFLRLFTENFNGVSRKFKGCLKKVSRVFQLRLKGVSISFKGVSRVLERSLTDFSGKLQWCFREL